MAVTKKEEGTKSASKKMLVKNKGGDAAPAQEAQPEQAAATAKKVITKAKTTVEKPAEKTAEPVSTEGAASVTGEDLIVQTAKEVENITEAKAFPMVERLQNSIEQDYFKLGGVLSMIQQNGWQMDKGFETFRAWVEAETGIKYRKAMYLIAIYDGLVESGVKWEQVKHLGWTKLKELAGILTPENVEEWVSLAENMTVIQLQEHIKSTTEGVGGAEGEAGEGTSTAKDTSTKTFKLKKDQRETVEAALDKAKHEGGTEFDSVALEYICIDYLNGSKAAKKLPTLAELMKAKSAEEVLEVFGKVFPKVELQVELPEEEEAS